MKDKNKIRIRESRSQDLPFVIGVLKLNCTLEDLFRVREYTTKLLGKENVLWTRYFPKTVFVQVVTSECESGSGVSAD